MFVARANTVHITTAYVWQTKSSMAQKKKIYLLCFVFFVFFQPRKFFICYKMIQNERNILKKFHFIIYEP